MTTRKFYEAARRGELPYPTSRTAANKGWPPLLYAWFLACAQLPDGDKIARERLTLEIEDSIRAGALPFVDKRIEWFIEQEVIEPHISAADFATWLRDRGIEPSELVREWFESQKLIEPPQGVPAESSASSAPPDGLPTAQIAVIFDGLSYTAESWPKRVSDTKWIQPAKRFQGPTGGASSILCPAHLAKLIHANAKGAQRQQRLEALNRRFKNIPELAPWRDDWNKHYELFSDADERR